MNNFDNLLITLELSNAISNIKLFFTLIFAYYIFIKIVNIKEIKKINVVVSITIIFLVEFILNILNYDMYYNFIFQFITLILVDYFSFKKDIVYTMLNTIISLGISYVLFFLSVIISCVPNVLFRITNDYINLIVLIVINFAVTYFGLKIKRIKNGLIFLQEKLKNEYLNILIFNLSVIVLCLYIILSLVDSLENYRDIVAMLIVLSIVMFITIKKSLEIYYKQTLLVKELDATKIELEDKKKEVEQLEKEILDFSKESHSLAHKQKALEYKINELMKVNSERGTELKEEIGELSKELYKEQAATELSKTDIPEIDDMLKYMQAECIKNKIDFDLQISGNIFYMTNNLVTRKELEILIADHIKDAIIAINYSDNINRSILVRLGDIDGIYSLYIYDSGIEFEKEILEMLGKKPITTHSDSGGTGMGFMNTFDTLRKHNASLIIDQYNKPNKDDYTKVIMIKFDGKNEFKY